MPFTRRHLGQFGEGVYDEVILAATNHHFTMAQWSSADTGLLPLLVSCR
jgi:hypothetical protein